MEKLEMLKKFLAKYGAQAAEALAENPRIATAGAAGAAGGALAGGLMPDEEGNRHPLLGAMGGAGIGAGAGALRPQIAALMAKYGAR